MGAVEVAPFTACSSVRFGRSNWTTTMQLPMNGSSTPWTRGQLISDGNRVKAFRLWRHTIDPQGVMHPLERNESLMLSIVGTWRLVRAEAFDTNGKPQPAPYGGTPVGRIMFTNSGRMMAMTGD